MKKSLLLLCILFISAFYVNAQHTNRQKRDLIEKNRWEEKGWHFAPGLTYTPSFKPKADSAPEVDPHGRLAVYLELGRWHLFPGGGNVFNYYDYSLAYKRLSGSEEFAGNKGIFKQNYVLANFNINNIIQLSDYMFIQNSLGLNLDYKISEKYESSGSPYLDNTNKLLFSLHYKLGIGFKATQKLFVIPTLETPILNGMEWEKARSDYGVFSSRYRPVIFTVRLAFLMKSKRNSCPPKPGGGGKNYDEMMKME